MSTEQEINLLKNKLTQIDLESIRAIRAVLVGSYVSDDMTKLMRLEHKADLIRAKLKKLEDANVGDRRQQ